MNSKITVYMKTGRQFVHFSECIDERSILDVMRAKVFGFETYKGGFASYKSDDVERIEIHGNENEVQNND